MFAVQVQEKTASVSTIHIKYWIRCNENECNADKINEKIDRLRPKCICFCIVGMLEEKKCKVENANTAANKWNTKTNIKKGRVICYVFMQTSIWTCFWLEQISIFAFKINFSKYMNCTKLNSKTTTWEEIKVLFCLDSPLQIYIFPFSDGMILDYY